jgi:membrane-bound lytic murein transglycosylase D
MIFGLTFVMADAPTVPNSIEFAGLNLKLSDRARKKIQSEVDALTRNPKYFQIKVDRLQIYFPIIERIFKEEGLPEDFKFLVLQESALISDAVSSSNAVGFWQFKRDAALEVGLRIDKNIDERLNIVSSTKGAAKYIKKNNRIYFDNWVHALLAYQQGPGGAQRLINKKYQGSRSMPIDSRTHWYVIKFLAHKIAFEQVKSSAPKLYLLEFYEGQGKTLKEISNQKTLDLELVLKYNKWLKRGRVPGDKPYAVILPYQDNSDVLMASGKPQREVSNVQFETVSSEYETHPAKYPIIKTYKRRNKGLKVNGIKAVRVSEETDLNSLSRTSNVSVKRLLYYNDVKANKKPKRGELWYLKPKRSKAAEAYHIVILGEDLWSISQKYGIKLSRLRKKNDISKNQTTVKVGRVLWLSETRPTGTPVAYVKPETSERQIKSENGSTHATDLGKDPEVINHRDPKRNSAVNTSPETREEVLKSDETSGPVKKEEPKNLRVSSKKVHDVRGGETLFGISKKYGVTVEDLQTWNDMEGSNTLSIGQQLIVWEDTQPNTEETMPSEAVKSRFKVHQVKAGETLYQIARQYNATIKQLMELNEKPDFNLKVGEKLRVPEKP